jgi:hypothetical protein
MTEPGSPLVQPMEVSRPALRKANPVSSEHSAIVYLTKRGSYVVGTSRLTMGELWLATPKEMYTVDVAPHQETFSMQLPSKEEAFFFTASVRVTWRISDPVAAVRDRLAERKPAVREYLEERLRDLTRDFTVEESASAERRINLDYDDRTIQVSAAVTVLRCKVVLDLEQSTREHIQSRVLAERRREAIEMSQLTEKYEHAKELQSAQHTRELEELRQEFELKLQRERIASYAEALRGGNLNLLALRLADNGDNVKDVVELVMEQDRMELGAAKAVLDSLVNANMLNRSDVAAIMARANDVVTRRLGGSGGLGIGSADLADDRPPPIQADVVRTDQPDEDEDDEPRF